jgi:4-hydroxythreonine-4-phosphate dehydrogenase
MTAPFQSPREAARLPIAVTSGDPAGIGFDVTVKAWADRAMHRLPPFYVLADRAALMARARMLELDIPIQQATPQTTLDCFETALPVVDIGHATPARPGRPTTDHAAAVLASIERAVDDVRTGRAAALVTNPIAKHVLYEAGFRHPGHTEYLGVLAKGWGAHPADFGYQGADFQPVMMLAGPQLRTVPVTVHVSLAQAAASLDIETIVTTGRIVAADLRTRFGIAQPRLAVAGLNPHAGEQGTMGREDIEIIEPAIARLRAHGIDAFGPLPADTLFHQRARATYDAVLCMYHDQALIPVKTIAFDETVNVTLGLPFVRTSPDHGTAFDIAGTGAAVADSFAAAVRLAGALSQHVMPAFT